MENCGKLFIYISDDAEFNKYDFGISLANKTLPYYWGGEFVIDDGKKAQRFESLKDGVYKWFVRLKNRSNIISEGFSEVNCDDLQTYKMSTAKGVELAGIIQNEVYQTMLRFAKKQNDYGFYSEVEIDKNFTGELILATEKNVVRIFSNLGILLRGKFLEELQDFEDNDYFIVKSYEHNLIYFNPELFDSIVNFQFFCKEEKYKDFLVEDFLKSEENGGFGNDYDSTLNILPDFILSLQD